MRFAHHWTRSAVMLPLFALLLTLAPLPVAQANHTPAPTSITLAGSLQQELGCPSDWQPACATTHLTNVGNGVWRGEFSVPPGSWEYKMVINDDWGNGSYAGNHQVNGNTTLDLAAATGNTTVRFYYDHKTHAVLDSVMDKVAVAAGTFQSDLGCSSDWNPACVATLLTDPDGDGKYTFAAAGLPAATYNFKVALNETFAVSYPASDVAVTIAAGERLVINWNSRTNEVTLGEQLGDLNKARAHWIDEDTIAWNPDGAATNSYRLFFSPNAGLALGLTGITGGSSITLTYDPAGLTAEQKARFPHLASFAALKIGAGDLGLVPQILKGQLAIEARDADDKLVDATALQIPGVLDDLFTYTGQLGVAYNTNGTQPTLRLWAPTASQVRLHLFDDATTEISTTIDMTYSATSGVWSAVGRNSWKGKYYLYEVRVFTRATNTVVSNFVTDPYAVSLSLNSTRSQIVNLDDPALKPAGWDATRKPKLAAPEDIALYELHIRDFSATDETVPAEQRGTFKAFTQTNSNGMRHLSALARAGLTTIHLLPAFDCASINEDKSTWQSPDFALLATYPPSSTLQRDAAAATRDQDGFNWCYDPFHYTVPEGSYSTNPNDTTRILEFREMVQSLNRTGLRVVMDVVYNHTNASGQSEKSVLDKVVPGYYHRLSLDGTVERSTCCENTASEHTMMEKLMVDSLVTWATAYKVDGFRFDLMGHHSLANMVKVRDTLQALTPAANGVDGKNIYIYGEGWNFGEVENNARFVQATQRNTAGSGLGTFNDRLRDAVRGGGPFSGLQEQGFATGLLTDPNSTNQGTQAAQLAKLLLHQDQIRVGLAGNLRDYQFIDRTGVVTTGASIDYNGNPTGYTLDPQETINYVEAHDNETLFDAVQAKAAATATITDRIRMDWMATDLVALGQGIPFFHAGQDILRSKSFDRDSYNSGDWFNRLDWSYQTNNFGVGLPPTGGNDELFASLLANPALKPTTSEIKGSAAHFREMLRIRNSSPLFRLRTAAAIQERLSFLNTGPNQVPGLIVMRLSDPRKPHFGNPYPEILVVFNATPQTLSFSNDLLKNSKLRLHPVQQGSADATTRSASFDNAAGTISVPGRTTAVFVMSNHLTALPLIVR